MSTRTPTRPAPPTGTATPSLARRLPVEALGTFWLVLAGCGTAVLAGDEVGFVGISLAFGLAVLTMAYAVGHVSGAHFNPAVSVGLAVAGRFAWRDVPGYVVAQAAGGSLGALVLYVVASGRSGFSLADGFATNGYGDLSPTGYSLLAVAVAEAVLTFVFLYVILGVTDRRAPAGFGPLAIGLALTLIHLISIPVSNTSVNPARSLAVAWFDLAALGQVWLFLLAPVVGAALAGATYALVTGVDRRGTEIDGDDRVG
ncbi:Aquaporin Z [Nocardioides aquaticus]|uniref:Aquaporin Z n=1 Tax=Nocardioides aquaticus TaxID=160826 RepID=A0ABX8ENF0_9ACTN|nr:aquaporin Z [Nocardioides aquaticus]QVT82011.1 Aquaporin Z [Nocardioides aquaticus]